MSNTGNIRATYTGLAFIGAGVVLLAVALTLLFVTGILHLPEPPVTVPTLSGLPGPTARSRLAQLGLLMRKGDVHFSAKVPRGSVIGQKPAPGVLVSRGTIVTVDLSAGSETFSMPDVSGLTAASALATLKGKGLSVQVERVDSRVASGTAIATIPSPGTPVSTADVVTLRVSASSGGGALLLPFTLKGISIVIDPAPSAVTPDVANEVARRLRSLLEASGAQVTETRSVVDPHPPAAQRQLRSIEASPALVVGLFAASDQPEGIYVTTPRVDGVTAPFYLRSVDLAKRTVTALVDAGLRAASEGSTNDSVVNGTAALGVRVHLGSYANRANLHDFSDPAWADLVARALYRAVGQTLAPRPPSPLGGNAATATP
jgi:hypothetical protein